MEKDPMKKCPDCGVRFYESTAPGVYMTDKDGIERRHMRCPRCGKYGPFQDIRVEDTWV